MSALGKIVDAYAEWDDPEAFRVFLVREDENGNADPSDAKPMEAELLGDSVEVRLYRAVMLHCAKDMAHQAHDRVLGFPKKGPAGRAAKAVKRELARIAKGEPAPTVEAVRLALMLVPKRRGGR